VISDFDVITVPGTNVLGLVVFSVVLGIILGTMEEKGRAMKECIDSLMLAIIEMVRLIIW
jgi:Na+/H+-dicarboxylate symporter